ncbi:ANL family adenylate-forming protein [Streptomyces sp. NRRL F-5630]|uniref:ANL family adenylate-forming protein n=1 Tax=Streptomyces sp. NRRL F-5630 TaxID=1463864 RepID=UPI003D728753
MLHLSSGSTDRPKVARRGLTSVLQDAEGYRTGLGLVPGDRVAVPVPLVHSFGWGIAVGALLSGCDIDVAPFVRAGTLARKADSGAVSVLALTPPVARLLIETRRQGESAPRAAMAGAGSVSDELDMAFQERFGVPLLRGYGSTETGGTFFGDHGMGRPVPGVDIVEPLPGERGELVLRLVAPVEGYLGDNQEPVQEWRTGDIVRHGTDGCVYFEQRVRGPLRLNGRFIRADITEQVLRSVPGVTDAFLLVLPRSDSPETEDFYAVVEGTASEEELLAALATVSARTPVPRVVVCDRLPRTRVGKRDRGALIEIVRKVSRRG